MKFIWKKKQVWVVFFFPQQYFALRRISVCFLNFLITSKFCFWIRTIIMVSFLTSDAIYYLIVFASLIGSLVAFRNIFSLSCLRVTDQGLDFYIYYNPVFVISICLCFLAILDNECVPGLSMCMDSLLGACHLQLAINWLEIASKCAQI